MTKKAMTPKKYLEVTYWQLISFDGFDAKTMYNAFKKKMIQMLTHLT